MRRSSTSETSSNGITHRLGWIVLVVCVLTVVGCQAQNGDRRAGERPVVQVVATDSSLQARSEVPAGWVTFRMRNKGTLHHSFRLKLLPAGKTYADYRREVIGPADSLERALLAGRVDTMAYRRALQRQLPGWWSRAPTVGGITGTPPGGRAQITHQLNPGTYVLSCLFSTPDRRTHAFLGVETALTVTEASSGAPPPTADVQAKLSEGTFEVDTSALGEKQTVAFRAVNTRSPGPSPGVGLFRVTNDTGTQAIVDWMGRGIPLPAPTAWLGGPEPMPAGNVAYVRVGDLPPGRYAWISLRAPKASGLVKSFTVEGAE